MAFEMKYDRDGQPIKNAALMAEPVEQPAPAETIQEPIEQPEPVELEAQVETEPEVEIKASQENQKNIKYIREAAKRADRLEWERDEALRRLKELEASRNSQPQMQQAEDPDDIGLGDTDLAEGKHLSKVSRKIKTLEKELQQYKQQTASQVTEARLKAQYPDFDKVVSKENVMALQEQYPEVANTLNSSTDLYSTAVSAYTMIKKLGIIQEEVYNPDKAQALKNLSKPRPLASLSPQQGDSPLSKANAFANGLTEDLKKQLAREMFEARNRI